MFLIDTNVLLDIATADPTWASWSSARLADATSRGPVLINPIIYTELAPAFATEGELDRWLDSNVFGAPRCHMRRRGRLRRHF